MDPISFIHELSFEDLSPAVVHSVKRLLIDNLGVCITGRQTKLADIAYDHAASVYSGSHTRLWLDGRGVSYPGAVFAHASACDSVDMHDGFARSDGHVGVAVVPAVLALLHDKRGRAVSGRELIATTAVGYEIAIRAGAVLHATSQTHHSSGAWNAIAVAAVYARRFGLSALQTRHALGIAEYNAPRSLVMRCVDYPTMVKDGSGWGAMTGMSAGMLAEKDFSGAPATTVEVGSDRRVQFEAAIAKEWKDLGQVFALQDVRTKEFAVCFWCQAPIYALRALQKEHRFTAGDIVKVVVVTYEKAMHLNHTRPGTTEEAQYSLPFSVAAGVVHGEVTGREVDGEELRNEQVLRLAQLITMEEDAQMSAEYYKGRCLCRVKVQLRDGRRVTSEDTVTEWDDVSDEQLDAKFRTIAAQTLSAPRVDKLLALLRALEHVCDVEELERLLQN